MSEAWLLLRAFWRWVAAAGAGTLVLVFLACGGCGGSDVTVAGRITNKNGKPVTWGTVTVVAADNRTYSAPIKPDGSYEVSGLPRGQYRIAVVSPNPTPTVIPPGERKAAPTPAPANASKGVAKADQPRVENRRAFGIDPTIPPPDIPAPRNPPPAGQWYPIPGKYSNPHTSGLGVSAADGRTSRDIVVE